LDFSAKVAIERTAGDTQLFGGLGRTERIAGIERNSKNGFVACFLDSTLWDDRSKPHHGEQQQALQARILYPSFQGGSGQTVRTVAAGI